MTLQEQVATYTHDLETALRETEGLFKAAQAILGARELETICQNLITHFNNLVHADQMILYLVDHEKQTILLAVQHGTVDDHLPMTYQELHDGISGLVFRTKHSIISLHPDDGIEPEATRKRRRQLNIGPLVVVPLMTKDTVIGTITAINRLEKRVFTQHDIDLLMALATQAAAAIENVQLYQLAQQELAERKRAEAALQQANEQLAKLNADKDKFFSIMAHDLKGPFMPLLGASDLMMQLTESLTRTQLKQMAEVINLSAKNVFALLENLLHWARLQQRQMKAKPEAVNLKLVVRNNLSLLNGNATDKNIKLISTMADDLFAYADQYMLDTVVRNLISNAIKFTPQGGEVTIGAVKLAPDFIEVAVTDTGVGVDERTKQRLFKIDQHVTTIGTAKEQGTGLGLKICYEMVVQNGGQIWIEGELGQGTTVKFTLPQLGSSYGTS